MATRFVRSTMAVALVFVLAVAYRIVTRSGMLTRIEPHFAGSCRVVTGVIGAEDVTIDGPAMVAFLSAQDRRAWRGGQGPRGELYALDLNAADARPRALTRGEPADFHPHGLSLWRSDDGQRWLFVINHRSDGSHTVEVFEVGAEELEHVRTVRYQELISPNDLVAVDRERFFATNDRGVPEPGWRQTLELYLALPWSTVSYFDGRHSGIVMRGLALANGIARSSDGTTLYIAECLGRAIHVMRRQPESGALSEFKRIDLPACPDNIEVDDQGQLWVATHPRLFDLVAHSEDAAKRAPSQVFRIDPHSGNVSEVYLSDGNPLSAASTAAVWGRTMVLGAIFDPQVLVCTLP
ncbi:MAG: SMP-30/gluconolactonase/LRE family protein [Candidatus Binatia bacterium]|nr:SMP-30/gluconolactonase/LRE family protein [Candidatus Binatia bacterium]